MVRKVISVTIFSFCLCSQIHSMNRSLIESNKMNESGGRKRKQKKKKDIVMIGWSQKVILVFIERF